MAGESYPTASRGTWRVTLGRLFNIGLKLYNLWRNIRADQHTAEQRARAAYAEARRQTEILEILEDPTASGRQGAAWRGNLDDARRAGLVNGGKGLFIGAIDGVALSYTGGAHGVVNAMTGAGKGLCGTGHVLAGFTEGVLIVPEIKNGEAFFMSAEHRSKFGPVYRLNPHNFFQAGTDSFDPCGNIKAAVKQAASVRASAMELASILWAEAPEKADTWTITGARQFFCGFACETATHRPEDCTLTEAYLFGERGNDEIVADLEAMADSDAPGDVAGFARKFISMIGTAPKQWEAIRDTYSQALSAYAPGERYATVTAPGGLDVGTIKGTVATIYLMGDGSSALVDGPWMAATINTMIDSFYRAAGNGKVLVWIEELLTLPRLYAVERALNLYRSGGIQVVAMIQSRGALIAKYGKEAALNFELQAGFVRYWTIEEPDLLRDLEFISGKTSVVVRHFSAQDSAFQQAGFGLGEVVRPLFTSDELRLLGPTKQLLRVPNCPLLVVDLVPWTEVAQYATALRDPRTLTRDAVITLPVPSTTPGGSPCSI